MKHLLLALLLVSFSSVCADTPESIAADYREKATAAVQKVNETLEKAAVPLIANLVKSGDTAGAGLLSEQLKAKMAGGPVLKPQASATNLFKLYDGAREKALEPAQKAAMARIDAMLAGSEGKKLDVVTELGKVRAEIEAGKVVQAATSSMPVEWTYHATEYPDGSVGAIYGEMHFHPDGSLTMLDRGKDKTPHPGRWKANQKGDKITLKMDDWKGEDGEWLMTITGTSATLDRDVGRRFMRVKAP